MKIGICDDEKEMRAWLGDKVRKLYPDAERLFYTSGEELLANPLPDILLLDIQMEGKDGMETARELRRMDERLILIFVTCTEDYVYQAFDVEAFHYLVKPLTDEKFSAVLKKAVGQFQKSGKPDNGETESLLITAGGTHYTVPVSEIVYAEVFDRKILLHTRNADIEYYGKMKDLEKKAGDGFFRTHRAYLVNFRFVRKYDAATVYLEKGRALMAKQKYPEFVKAYLRYNQKKRGNSWNCAG